MKEIPTRHASDGWKDVVFICVAVLLTALSIGSVTSKAAGKPHQWTGTVTFEEHPELAH